MNTLLQRLILFTFLFLLVVPPATPLDVDKVDKWFSLWEKKRELASELLEKSRLEFEHGDELSACADQQEAGNYGIEATEALIIAMKANGTTDGIENQGTSAINHSGRKK